MKKHGKSGFILGCVFLLGTIFNGNFIAKAVEDNLPPELIEITTEKVGDEKLILKVKAEDSSGLKEDAQICFVKEDGKNNTEEYFTLGLLDGVYQKEINLVDDLPQGKWKVSFLALTDNVDNTGIVYNNTIHGKITFNEKVFSKDLSNTDVEVQDSFKAEVVKVKADKNLVKKGEKVNLKVEVKDGKKLSNKMKAVYVLKNVGTEVQKEVELKLKDNAYETQIDTAIFENLGTWKIHHLVLKNDVEKNSAIYNSQVCTDNKFKDVQKMDMLDGNLSIQLDESTLNNTVDVSVSNKEVKRGETLSLEVKAKDLKYQFKDEAYVCLVNKGAGTMLEKYVNLKQTEVGVFKKDILIDKTFSSGDWKVSFVVIENKNDESLIVYNKDVHKTIGEDLSKADFKIIEKSNNADLKNIIINGNTLSDFKADVLEYSYEINDGNIPQIKAEAFDPKAKVEITTPQSIVGTAVITVTSEDRSVTKAYKVNFTDDISDDVCLNSIIINGKPLNGFNSNVYEYVYGVDDGKVPSIEAKAGSKAKVEIVKPESIPGIATITVRAENGMKTVYTIKLVESIKVSVISDTTSFKKGQDAKVIVQAINECKEEKNVALVVGLFDENNRLVHHVAAEQLIKASETVNLQGCISIPNNYGQYKLRVFVWDSLKGMHIINKSMEFEVK